MPYRRAVQTIHSEQNSNFTLVLVCRLPTGSLYFQPFQIMLHRRKLLSAYTQRAVFASLFHESFTSHSCHQNTDKEDKGKAKLSQCGAQNSDPDPWKSHWLSRTGLWRTCFFFRNTEQERTEKIIAVNWQVVFKHICGLFYFLFSIFLKFFFYPQFWCLCHYRKPEIQTGI